MQKNIRNFSIIAHIDHGKSTLADRFLEMTGSVEKAQNQMLDSMELERERGITIKLKAIRMKLTHEGEEFELNIIDTPGHVDFGYEVSRALAACEGALLVVDATQGVQAQTIANFEKARAEGLKILPVVNKIDLPSARIEETILQLFDLGFTEDDVSLVSAKTGEGVEALLHRLIDVFPPPKTESTLETRALVFDSYYDDYRGVIVFVKVLSGGFSSSDTVTFLASSAQSRIVELGYLTPQIVTCGTLQAGEVGYIATGFKTVADARVGDTVTKMGESPLPIPGYHEPSPVVFLSFYPYDSSQYQKLREAMDKLNLSDAAFTFQPESIGALGRGFRCGFLGLLHADIMQERIEREFHVSVLATTPSVLYELTTTKQEQHTIKSAAEYPDPSTIQVVREPWARLSVYTLSTYMSAVMDLCKERRAVYIETHQYSDTRMKLVYEIPLIELIIDFYDRLKSLSSGYASLDYELIGYRPTDVVRLDFFIAKEFIAPLSILVQRGNVQHEAQRIVKLLKDIIPRQQFVVSIQAAIGGKFVAREDISAVRKDVTGYLYGGDVTRKNKLLDKQKKGKKRMKQFGKVELPQDVFWKVMKRG